MPVCICLYARMCLRSDREENIHLNCYTDQLPFGGVVLSNTTIILLKERHTVIRVGAVF